MNIPTYEEWRTDFLHKFDVEKWNAYGYTCKNCNYECVWLEGNLQYLYNRLCEPCKRCNKIAWWDFFNPPPEEEDW